MKRWWLLFPLLAALLSGAASPAQAPLSRPALRYALSPEPAELAWAITEPVDTWVLRLHTPDGIQFYYAGAVPPGGVVRYAAPARLILRLELAELCAWQLDDQAPGGYWETCWEYGPIRLLHVPLVGSGQ